MKTLPISLNANDLKKINDLLTQLSPKARTLTFEEATAILLQKNFFLLLMRDPTKVDGEVVGMASIYFIETLMGTKGYIEDVVVDKAFRGKGFGKDLTIGLIDIAKSIGARYVDLTSLPDREAANEMYKSLGFEKRDTNVYRLRLLP